MAKNSQQIQNLESPKKSKKIHQKSTQIQKNPKIQNNNKKKKIIIIKSI